MKYQMKVYYRNEAMNKITELMGELIPEWGSDKRRLEGCRVFEFTTNEPLSPEIIEKLKALKEDWMDEIVIEEVPSL